MSEHPNNCIEEMKKLLEEAKKVAVPTPNKLINKVGGLEAVVVICGFSSLTGYCIGVGIAGRVVDREIVFAILGVVLLAFVWAKINPFDPERRRKRDEHRREDELYNREKNSINSQSKNDMTPKSRIRILTSNTEQHLHVVLENEPVKVSQESILMVQNSSTKLYYEILSIVLEEAWLDELSQKDKKLLMSIVRQMVLKYSHRMHVIGKTQKAGNVGIDANNLWRIRCMLQNKLKELKETYFSRRDTDGDGVPDIKRSMISQPQSRIEERRLQEIHGEWHTLFWGQKNKLKTYKDKLNHNFWFLKDSQLLLPKSKRSSQSEESSIKIDTYAKYSMHYSEEGRIKECYSEKSNPICLN